MGQKLIVGPINKGLKTYFLPFNIDNDSFPVLINAYQQRGRVKRKRGTQFLTRLTRFFDSTLSNYSLITSFNLSSGAGNLVTGFDLQTNSNIVPGNVSIFDINTSTTYTDLNEDGTLQGSPSGSGTIDYATGAITILGGANDSISASFSYNTSLPVMGLEDFITTSSAFPFTISFDTVYAYNLMTSAPYSAYDVSFYNNPSSGSYKNYVAKDVWTPTSWNGENYQQFWTTNYQGALWATNGIDVPFTGANIGMQFNRVTAVTNIILIVGGGSSAQLTIADHGLVVGDFLFLNEFNTAVVQGLNFQTGYVTTEVDTSNVIVTFPNATLSGGGATSTGIAQYLTSRSNSRIDCLRWYNGDPTNGSTITPGFVNNRGWVNFMPPLSQAVFSIDDTPQAQYYLVGARMILPFKDRLIFFGPVIQTSTGNPIYLQDAIIYSLNGTAYYTSSFTGDLNLANTEFFPILVPTNQSAVPYAYFEDSTGFGGNIVAGLDQPINTISSNEDVLILGFDTLQARMVYSGNDIIPFNLFIINSELGSSSTFSTINMDQGVITRGSRGYIITAQTSAQRIDLDIPDQVFEIDLLNNGEERFCAQRDYINEWIYFSYPNNTDASTTPYPDTTLLYNYRDNSWAVFYESYTTYGSFRKQTGLTWSSVGNTYPTWNNWNDPWDAGESTVLQPQVIAGNQQGFVVIKGVGTGEGPSLFIQSFSGITVTSPSHNLLNGDFIQIIGCLGTIGQEVNGKIFSIASPDENTFKINIDSTGKTYLGGGLIIKFYVPEIQTKQFPIAWELGRKTRIGFQQYLLTKTFNAQISLYIFLSTDDSNPYNFGPIVPDPLSINNTLIYSSILYTCPESTNLGLTPANENLQMPTASTQQQIWHRVNTSLIGDTVQLGFTLSKDQMLSLIPDLSKEPFPITGATPTSPCVLTCSGKFQTAQLIKITGVQGMIQLNFVETENNYYYVISSDDTTVTIDVDATGFGAYTSGGTAQVYAPIYQTAEIELHAFIMDLNPSSLLS